VTIADIIVGINLRFVVVIIVGLVLDDIGLDFDLVF
jgi:hypothetical protein